MTVSQNRKIIRQAPCEAVCGLNMEVQPVLSYLCSSTFMLSFFNCLLNLNRARLWAKVPLLTFRQFTTILKIGAEAPRETAMRDG